MTTAPERANRAGDSQPLPTPNGAPDVQAAVIVDILERRKLGISRYGTALQPHNGRNALLDAYDTRKDDAITGALRANPDLTREQLQVRP